MVGDEILSVDGHGIWVYEDVVTFLNRNDGNGVDLVVRRNGEEIVLNDFPMERYDYEFDGRKGYGFGLIFGQKESLSIFGRVQLAAAQTLNFVRTVWISLGDLVTGRVGVDQMSGVIGVVDVVSAVGTQADSFWMGVQDVFYLMALIAVNLAVMNMLPIPALDGGRVLFVLINGISYLVFRRHIPQRLEGTIHGVALIMLLVVMVLVAFQDVWKIFV